MNYKLWRQVKVMDDQQRTRKRHHTCFLWLAWSVITLLGLSALGFSPAYQISRWSGALLGLVLAGVWMNFEGKGQDESNFHPLWMIACFIIGCFLAEGPQGVDTDDGYVPASYAQAIRFWAITDTLAVVLYGTTMGRLFRVWESQEKEHDNTRDSACQLAADTEGPIPATYDWKKGFIWDQERLNAGPPVAAPLRIKMLCTSCNATGFIHGQIECQRCGGKGEIEQSP